MKLRMHLNYSQIYKKGWNSLCGKLFNHKIISKIQRSQTLNFLRAKIVNHSGNKQFIQQLWIDISFGSNRQPYQSLESQNILATKQVHMSTNPNPAVASKKKPITKFRHRNFQGRNTTIKQIIIDPSQTDVSHFLNEANLLSACNHPRVVSYLNSSLSKDKVFSIEMERLEGGTLEKGISGDYEKMIKWIFQICEGLQYIHQIGIIHRDIKLSNLMLDGDGNVKIIDFGVSIFKKSIPNQGKKAVGTPVYVAPEMILQRKYDQKIDVYALGVCMYQLIYNRLPFDSSDVHEYLKNTITKDITYENSCPPEILNLMKAMLEKTPSRRLSVDQIMRYIQRVLVKTD